MALTLTQTATTLQARVEVKDVVGIDTYWCGEGLIGLFCKAAGVDRVDVRRTLQENGSEEEPRRKEVWEARSGAVMTITAEGIASGHGVHGEVLSARVTGLPAGVSFRADSSLDRRSGGELRVTLEGREGLGPFVSALKALAS